MDYVDAEKTDTIEYVVVYKPIKFGETLRRDNTEPIPSNREGVETNEKQRKLN